MTFVVLRFPIESGMTFVVLRFPIRSGMTFVVLRFPIESGMTFAVLRFPIRSGMTFVPSLPAPTGNLSGMTLHYHFVDIDFKVTALDEIV